MRNRSTTCLGTVTSWVHDVVDRRESATLGNGIISAFDYDANDRLINLRHANPSEDILCPLNEVHPAPGAAGGDRAREPE